MRKFPAIRATCDFVFFYRSFAWFRFWEEGLKLQFKVSTTSLEMGAAGGQWLKPDRGTSTEFYNITEVWHSRLICRLQIVGASRQAWLYLTSASITIREAWTSDFPGTMCDLWLAAEFPRVQSRFCRDPRNNRVVEFHLANSALKAVQLCHNITS